MGLNGQNLVDYIKFFVLTLDYYREIGRFTYQSGIPPQEFIYEKYFLLIPTTQVCIRICPDVRTY